MLAKLKYIANRIMQKDIQLEPFHPPADPVWWAFWHATALNDDFRRTLPGDRPEQEYGFQVRRMAGIALAPNADGVLTGNEVAGVLALRHAPVTEQPKQQETMSAAALSAILRAGAGQLRK